MRHPGKDFPSSAENIRAIYKEGLRLLKSGGILIAQIGKKKYSVLDDGFIKKLPLKDFEIKNIGGASQMVVMHKK